MFLRPHIFDDLAGVVNNAEGPDDYARSICHAFGENKKSGPGWSPWKRWHRREIGVGGAPFVEFDGKNLHAANTLWRVRCRQPLGGRALSLWGRMVAFNRRIANPPQVDNTPHDIIVSNA